MGICPFYFQFDPIRNKTSLFHWLYIYKVSAQNVHPISKERKNPVGKRKVP